MYFSLSELDVAVARHQELVAVADRTWLTRRSVRPKRRPGASPLRRSAGVALVRIGERLQGCAVSCEPRLAR